MQISEGEFIADNDVVAMSAIFDAAVNPAKIGHQFARRIVERKPYKSVWSPTLDQKREAAKEGKVAGEELVAQLKVEFGEEAVVHDASPPKQTNVNFPVIQRNGDIVQASTLSELLTDLPEPSCEFIFLTDDSLIAPVRAWIRHYSAVAS